MTNTELVVTTKIELPNFTGNVFERWNAAKAELVAAREALINEGDRLIALVKSQCGQDIAGMHIDFMNEQWNRFIKIEKSEQTSIRKYGTHIANMGYHIEYGLQDDEVYNGTMSKIKEDIAALKAAKEQLESLVMAKLSV